MIVIKLSPPMSLSCPLGVLREPISRADLRWELLRRIASDPGGCPAALVPDVNVRLFRLRSMLDPLALGDNADGLILRRGAVLLINPDLDVRIEKTN